MRSSAGTKENSKNGYTIKKCITNYFRHLPKNVPILTENCPFSRLTLTNRWDTMLISKESNSFDIFCGSGWDYYPARVHFWLKCRMGRIGVIGAAKQYVLMLTLLQCCFPKGLKVKVRKLKQLKAAKQISNSNTLPKKGRSSPGGLLRYNYQPLIKRTTGFLAALVSSGLPTGVVLGQA